MSALPTWNDAWAGQEASTNFILSNDHRFYGDARGSLSTTSADPSTTYMESCIVPHLSTVEP